LNISGFIAKGLFKNEKGTFAFTVTRIATWSIAIGLAILIISYAILKGFNHEIQEKIFSVAGHLQVVKTAKQYSFEDNPMSIHADIYEKSKEISVITHIYPFIRKPSIMKTSEGVQGVLIKGINQQFLATPFTKTLLNGSMPIFNDTTFSRDVVISKMLADKMRVDVGDEFLFYFIQNPPKFRKMVVSGIYQTGMEELDQRFVFCDYKMIQGINQWDDTLVGGFDILLHDFSQIDDHQFIVFDAMDYNLSLSSIKDRYAQIFDWFKLLQNNVTLLMVIIFGIVCINVSTSFIIIILEKIRFIGTLKALGATNSQIRKIFFLNGAKVVAKGLLIGNMVGIGICVLQYYTHIIPLDAQNYYVSFVPILFDVSNFIFVNIVLLIVSAMSLALPTFIISNISPIKSIRME
jgi:lipoprotein-releasing system permease protein